MNAIVNGCVFEYCETFYRKVSGGKLLWLKKTFT